MFKIHVVLGVLLVICTMVFVTKCNKPDTDCFDGVLIPELPDIIPGLSEYLLSIETCNSTETLLGCRRNKCECVSDLNLPPINDEIGKLKVDMRWDEVRGKCMGSPSAICPTSQAVDLLANFECSDGGRCKSLGSIGSLPIPIGTCSANTFTFSSIFAIISILLSIFV